MYVCYAQLLLTFLIATTWPWLFLMLCTAVRVLNPISCSRGLIAYSFASLITTLSLQQVHQTIYCSGLDSLVLAVIMMLSELAAAYINFFIICACYNLDFVQSGGVLRSIFSFGSIRRIPALLALNIYTIPPADVIARQQPAPSEQDEDEIDNELDDDDAEGRVNDQDFFRQVRENYNDFFQHHVNNPVSAYSGVVLDADNVTGAITSALTYPNQTNVPYSIKNQMLRGCYARLAEIIRVLLNHADFHVDMILVKPKEICLDDTVDRTIDGKTFKYDPTKYIIYIDCATHAVATTTHVSAEFIQLYFKLKLQDFGFSIWDGNLVYLQVTVQIPRIAQYQFINDLYENTKTTLLLTAGSELAV